MTYTIVNGTPIKVNYQAMNAQELIAEKRDIYRKQAAARAKGHRAEDAGAEEIAIGCYQFCGDLSNHLIAIADIEQARENV